MELVTYEMTYESIARKPLASMRPSQSMSVAKRDQIRCLWATGVGGNYHAARMNMKKLMMAATWKPHCQPIVPVKTPPRTIPIPKPNG